MAFDLKQLTIVQKRISDCRACPNVVGPPIHGPAIESEIFLVGQAPGPHEGKKGRPFAHTAGKRLFEWFQSAGQVSEEKFRASVYMVAVARCFPGKAKGGADRVPDAMEIKNCSEHMGREVELLRPRLVIAVGRLAIETILGEKVFSKKAKLSEVVGRTFRARYFGYDVDVIPLPHPSGLSSWHKVEPGVSLLRDALGIVVHHEAWLRTFEINRP
ncbi:MAG: uracil-DNA glycosylase [Proteobacteria bacterium]|nr:MAG: uracil-DNA glycosylase [Pseudomonadota bacterium]